jgi:hypothetical protein
VRSRSVAERDFADRSVGRIEESQLAGRLSRVPDLAVRRRRDVVRPRSGRHLIFLDAEGQGPGAGTQATPLGLEDPADHAEATRAERAKDQRLAFLEREPGGVADNAAVGDQDRHGSRLRLGAEQPPHSCDLGPPAGVVDRDDGVQERAARRRPAEGESRGLEGAAERTREHETDA